MLEAKFEVLLVNKATVLKGVDQFWRMLLAKFEVLEVKRATEEAADEIL